MTRSNEAQSASENEETSSFLKKIDILKGKVLISLLLFYKSSQ